MGLLSYFKRSTDTPAEAAAPPEADAVAAARARARQRLIGATVLLGIGVIGFPLLFETQPRPIPVNIPIEIPRKDGAAPLVLPPAAPALSPASAAQLETEPTAANRAPGNAAARPAAAATDIVERAGDQGRDLSAAALAARNLTPPTAATAATTSAQAPASAAKPATAAAKPPAANPAADGARAQALLNGQPPAIASAASAAAPARVVVQVGAYSDPVKLREARQKLEKLGLQTYTQVVEVDGAKRTRVRVGPFANRAEADKAAARIKAAGLPVAVLAL